jgi:hypothetical protein
VHTQLGFADDSYHSYGYANVVVAKSHQPDGAGNL